MRSSRNGILTIILTKRSKLPVSERIKRDRLFDSLTTLFWFFVGIFIFFASIYFYVRKS